VRTTPPRARADFTARSLSIGSFTAAACFLVAIVLAAAGRPAAGGPALDPVATIEGLVTLDARAWASAGVLCMLAAPVAGLIATVVEYARAHGSPERRYALAALAVLAVLAVSLGVALSR
jgi:hypothetical protein